MNKKEFMRELKALLKDVPKEEREEAIAYYNSYFEDAGVENEEKILEELESPEKVAEMIKAEMGMESGANDESETTPRKIEWEKPVFWVVLFLVALLIIGVAYKKSVDKKETVIENESNMMGNENTMIENPGGTGNDGGTGNVTVPNVDEGNGPGTGEEYEGNEPEIGEEGNESGAGEEGSEGKEPEAEEEGNEGNEPGAGEEGSEGNESGAGEEGSEGNESGAGEGGSEGNELENTGDETGSEGGGIGVKDSSIGSEAGAVENN